jgi:hypothetical protein
MCPVWTEVSRREPATSKGDGTSWRLDDRALAPHDPHLVYFPGWNWFEAK